MIASTGDMDFYLPVDLVGLDTRLFYSICKLEKLSGLCSDCRSAVNSNMSQLSWKDDLPGRLIRLHTVPYFKQIAWEMMKLRDC